MRRAECPERVDSGRFSGGGDWRRLRRGARQVRPDAAQRPDPRQQRVAVVLDRAVQQREKRRDFLIGQLERHPVGFLSEQPREALHEASVGRRSEQHGAPHFLARRQLSEARGYRLW